MTTYRAADARSVWISFCPDGAAPAGAKHAEPVTVGYAFGSSVKPPPPVEAGAVVDALGVPEAVGQLSDAGCVV